jgi:hypothetical protein
MRGRFSGSITTGAIVVAGVGAVISVCITPACAQAPEASAIAAASTLKTPWGEPDLQGIWTDEFDTPLQRSAQYENQEFFTQAQRAELDKERRALLDRDQRGERGTEADVAGAYSFAVFLSTKHTGARTSLIVDPHLQPDTSANDGLGSKRAVKICQRWRQLLPKAAIAVPFPRSRGCYSFV